MDVRDDTVRLGIIGLGYWGPNLVRALHEVVGAEVAWICDLDEGALEVTGRRYPAVRRTTSVAEVIGDERVDAVVIATPVSTHAPLAMAALDAGKHVLVEKPLAGSSEHAKAMVDLADERGLVLMPGHTFLYSPAVNVVRSMIESGELGDIYFISTSRVNLGLHQKDVSVAWDLGPHDFSILRYWLDETPASVSVLARGCVMTDVPDVAFINLQFASGPVAHVEIAWLAPTKLRRTTICGSKKMVVYDDTSNEPVRIFDSGVAIPNPESFGEYKLTYRTGDILSPRVAIAEPLVLEMTDFCDSIRTSAVPRSSAALGLEVVRMIEAVDASLAGGGHPIELAARVG